MNPPSIIVDSNRNSPRATISAGPAEDVVILPAQVERARRASARAPDFRPIPRASAAAAAPVEPVPELMVSPAPRSKKRTSSVCRSTTRTKETLVRFGKARMPLDPAPSAAPVEIEIVDEDGALRIADVQDRGLAVRARSWRAILPCAPVPCSSRTNRPDLALSSSRRCLRPAPVRIRIVRIP